MSNLGLAGGITQYMLSLNITIPAKTTICDYFMFEISQFKARTQQHVSKLNSIAYNERQSKQIDKQIIQAKEVCPDGYQRTKVVHSFFKQLSILMSRQIRLFVRNPMKIGRAIGNSLLTVIIVGLIFLHSISDNRPSTDQVYSPFDLIIYFIQAQGTAFISVTNIIMTGIFSVALLFPVERQVFSKQIASKTYSALPFFISKLFIQAFSLIAAVIIFASGCYWLQGYSSSFQQFLKFGITLCSVALVGNSIGFWTGSLFKDAQRSSAMAPALLMPLMMFSGLYNKLDSIPKFISWLQYISPFRYGLHAVLLNQFEDEKYFMFSGELFDYKQSLSINLTFWQNIGILLGIAGLYYILAFIFLKTLSSRISA